MTFYSAPSCSTFSLKRSGILMLDLTCQLNKRFALGFFIQKDSNLYLGVNLFYKTNSCDYLLFSF